MIFHKFSCHHLRVYYELTSSQWLDSSVGRAPHRYRRGHGFESRTSLNLFSGFNFTTALVVCITAMINQFFSLITVLKRERYFQLISHDY